MRKYDAHSPVNNISPSLHLNCKKYKVLKIKYKTYCWLSFTKKDNLGLVLNNKTSCIISRFNNQA